MNIDGKNVKKTYMYNFNLSGNHIVYVLLNTTNIISFDYMF